VHDETQPGNPNAWIKQGTFVLACINCPDGFATNNIYAPFNVAYAISAVTTNGWYNNAQIDAGYDIGIVVLSNRNGTSNEMGSYTGFFGFCYSACLLQDFYLTQIGYPHNYANGDWQYIGQHLEVSDGMDFVFGSGALGGSSGGPHIANLGTLYDSSTAPGEFPNRNVVFATTSWGFTDETLKVQGGSSLSGPSDSNNFKGMYNVACTYSRSVHGTGSCALLP
jgi:hypothetical protein